MLARGLAVALLVLATGAAWVAAGQPWAIPLRVAFGVALVVAVPVAIALAAYALAAVYRTPAPPAYRVPAGRMAGFIVREALTFAAVYLVLQPFPRLWLPRETGQRSGEKLPILLVPGFVCNAGLWSWFARALRKRGYAAFTVTLDPVFGPIDGNAALIAQRIDAIAEAAGRPVVLVGHSMGGLVARAYLRLQGGRNVARVITIGAPHHGSALAPFGYGQNAREMRQTAEWLGGLAAFEEGHYPVPVTSIFSFHDNFVAPQISSELAGAANIPLGGLGHMSLAYSRRVLDLVVAEIESGPQR